MNDFDFVIFEICCNLGIRIKEEEKVEHDFSNPELDCFALIMW